MVIHKHVDPDALWSGINLGSKQQRQYHTARPSLSANSDIHHHMLMTIRAPILVRLWCCMITFFLTDLCGGYNYDSTSIRRPFDGHSTAYEWSLKSQPQLR